MNEPTPKKRQRRATAKPAAPKPALALNTPLASVEAMLVEIEAAMVAEKSRKDADGKPVDPDPDVLEQLRGRKLQSERLRAHIVLQEKKLNTNLLASPEAEKTLTAVADAVSDCKACFPLVTAVLKGLEKKAKK